MLKIIGLIKNMEKKNQVIIFLEEIKHNKFVSKKYKDL